MGPTKQLRPRRRKIAKTSSAEPRVGGASVVAGRVGGMMRSLEEGSCDNAFDNVATCLFIPSILNDKAVPVRLMIEVRFQTYEARADDTRYEFIYAENGNRRQPCFSS